MDIELACEIFKFLIIIVFFLVLVAIVILLGFIYSKLDDISEANKDLVQVLSQRA